jgi:hypothetical protein
MKYHIIQSTISFNKAKTALPNPLYESENRTPAALTKISVEKGPAALFKKISQHLGKWCGRPM